MNNEHNLVTGGNDHFIEHLKDAINNATHIDLAVSFIRDSGLKYLIDPLRDALEQNAKLRVLTSTYLNVTEPDALRKLLLLKSFKETKVEVRVHQVEDGKSFHPKVYIFITKEDSNIIDGQAFVGSSNLSHVALHDGVEWNIRIKFDSDRDTFLEIHKKFNDLFDAKHNIILSHDWIDEYDKSRNVRIQLNPGDDAFVPTPTQLQEWALKSLHEARENQQRRGLVVLATGLGKTWLSAFDSQRANAKKILFVAHREEILNQAELTYATICPNARIGQYTGKHKDKDVDILFGSVQTLGRKEHLERFPKNYFDYIVVDEFHHASASSYQKLLNYFEPNFMLGLTATPNRTDNADVLSLCHDNLVYTADLIEGINRELLCPFHYYGIHDKYVDYQAIPWRSNKFDPTQLEHALLTNKRAEHIFSEWKAKAQSKTLAFCCSKRHSDYMADFFSQKGISTVSIHSSSAIRRNVALDGLRDGRFEIVFTVDLFNEGVDVPNIDTVLMLRPTESKILFLQQLGRGLRRAEGKEKLVVLDFIGNHKSFLKKPDALFELGSTNQAYEKFFQQLPKNEWEMPNGCSMNYDLEILDFMTKLVAAKKDTYETIYESLKEVKESRPTLTDMFVAGASITNIRKDYGSWFDFVKHMGDLEDTVILGNHSKFFAEIEKTLMSKSYKIVTLEALISKSGFTDFLTVEEVADEALNVFRSRVKIRKDFMSKFESLEYIENNFREWVIYWRANPINALIGGNSKETPWFMLKDGRFTPKFVVSINEQESFYVFLQEILNYRYRQYEPRLDKNISKVLSIKESDGLKKIQIPISDRDKLPFGEEKLIIDHNQFTGVFLNSEIHEIFDSENRVKTEELLKQWTELDVSELQLNYLDKKWHLSPFQDVVLKEEQIEIPYYPDLKIACGHFKPGYTDEVEKMFIPTHYGPIDPEIHFLAQASGNSMDGTMKPIKDQDYLLLERVSPNNAGSISNQIIVAEIGDGDFEDNQFLLRKVIKEGHNEYFLRALNPDYVDLEVGPETPMRTRARLKRVIKPLDLALHKEYMRNEIPSLFGVEFSAGLWQSGHVCPKQIEDHILLVTLKKADLNKEHRYHDYFESSSKFHWQSQNSTTPYNKKGREIINHKQESRSIHLFVRPDKMRGKKACPFTYLGELEYLDHNSEKPMNVNWELLFPLSAELRDQFMNQ